jgi:uncharacterized protein
VTDEPSVAPPATGSDPDGIRRLLDLQEIDLAIDRARARLDALRVGEEVAGAAARATEAETALGQLRLELDDVAREQRRMESDIDSIERKTAAERKRLYDGSVANVKELQSIEHEVTALAQRKTRMEDAVLELMERREELERPLASREADVETARERLAELEGSAARELVQLQGSLAERQGERDTLARSFDPELLELYEDLRRQKKGVGAAALIDGVCQGCHQKLSAVYLAGLKRQTGIRRCEYCRRILIAE